MPLCETVLTATPRYSLTQMSLAAPFSCYVSMYLFLTHVSVPLFITNLYIRSPLFSFQQYISWIIFVIYRWFLFVAQGPVFSLSVRSVSCLICQTAGRRRLRKRCGCQGCVHCRRRAAACSEMYCIFEACQDLACPQGLTVWDCNKYGRALHVTWNRETGTLPCYFPHK